MTIDDLQLKVSNGGTSPEGKLSAEEYNVLLDTVKGILTQVQALGRNKANTATTLAGYGIEDAYTKDESREFVTQVVTENTRDFPTRTEIKETYVYRDKNDIQKTLGISDWALAKTLVLGGKEVLDAPIASSYAVYFDSGTPMLPNKIYIANDNYTIVQIDTITPPEGKCGEYSLHFYATSTSTRISLPSSVLWANGEIPTIEAGCYYELSIMAIQIPNSQYVYKAILTPFKQA